MFPVVGYSRLQYVSFSAVSDGLSNTPVRLAAARTRCKIKDRLAIEPLIEAAGDVYAAVGQEANGALHEITAHKVDTPIGRGASTIRTYRQPLWQRWWEENKAKFEK